MTVFKIRADESEPNYITMKVFVGLDEETMQLAGELRFKSSGKFGVYSPESEAELFGLAVAAGYRFLAQTRVGEHLQMIFENDNGTTTDMA